MKHEQHQPMRQSQLRQVFWSEGGCHYVDVHGNALAFGVQVDGLHRSSADMTTELQSTIDRLKADNRAIAEWNAKLQKEIEGHRELIDNLRRDIACKDHELKIVDQFAKLICGRRIEDDRYVDDR